MSLAKSEKFPFFHFPHLPYDLFLKGTRTAMAASFDSGRPSSVSAMHHFVEVIPWSCPSVEL
jgi:hypothetical protein